jgi:hypothetical protein
LLIRGWYQRGAGIDRRFPPDLDVPLSISWKANMSTYQYESETWVHIPNIPNYIICNSSKYYH